MNRGLLFACLCVVSGNVAASEYEIADPIFDGQLYEAQVFVCLSELQWHELYQDLTTRHKNSGHYWVGLPVLGEDLNVVSIWRHGLKPQSDSQQASSPGGVDAEERRSDSPSAPVSPDSTDSSSETLGDSQDQTTVPAAPTTNNKVYHLVMEVLGKAVVREIQREVVRNTQVGKNHPHLVNGGTAVAVEMLLAGAKGELDVTKAAKIMCCEAIVHGASYAEQEWKDSLPQWAQELSDKKQKLTKDSIIYWTLFEVVPRAFLDALLAVCMS